MDHGGKALPNLYDEFTIVASPGPKRLNKFRKKAATRKLQALPNTWNLFSSRNFLDASRGDIYSAETT